MQHRGAISRDKELLEGNVKLKKKKYHEYFPCKD